MGSFYEFQIPATASLETMKWRMAEVISKAFEKIVHPLELVITLVKEDNEIVTIIEEEYNPEDFGKYIVVVYVIKQQIMSEAAMKIINRYCVELKTDDDKLFYREDSQSPAVMARDFLLAPGYFLAPVQVI